MLNRILPYAVKLRAVIRYTRYRSRICSFSRLRFVEFRACKLESKSGKGSDMYKQKNAEWLRNIDFEILDFLCMALSLMLCRAIRAEKISVLFEDEFRSILIVLFVSHVIAIIFGKFYFDIVQRGYYREMAETIKMVTIVYLIFLSISFSLRFTDELSRIAIIGAWGVSIATSYLVRIVYKLFVQKIRFRPEKKNKMLLLTTPDRFEKTLRNLESRRFQHFIISTICFLEAEDDEQRNRGIHRVLDKGKEYVEYGTPFWEFIRGSVIDEVYIDAYENRKQLRNLTDQLLDAGIVCHIGLVEIPEKLPHQQITKFSDAAYAITTMNSVAPSWQLILKRMMDIAGAIVGLLITGIACIFVVPAIKIADPGPVFFVQKRVGKSGRIFNFYKFRSMYVDAEKRKEELMSQNQMSGLMFKMENDPRIIGSEKGPGKGFGNFIRKTSIDELPQFWNVLKGDMSLVGTRPPTVSEYEKYELHHKIRLSMKPGLTGMWQVSGRSDITNFEEVVKLDTSYIANWNLGLDIKIIFMTIGVILHHTGAR